MRTRELSCASATGSGMADRIRYAAAFTLSFVCGLVAMAAAEASHRVSGTALVTPRRTWLRTVVRTARRHASEAR